MVALPSEDDIGIIFRIEGSGQVVGGLTAVFVAAAIVESAKQPFLKTRRRAFILVNDLVLRIFHLEGNTADIGIGCSSIKVVVAQCHLETLHLCTGRVGGQKVDVSASRILHGDTAAVPALEA